MDKYFRGCVQKMPAAGGLSRVHQAKLQAATSVIPSSAINSANLALDALDPTNPPVAAHPWSRHSHCPPTKIQFRPKTEFPAFGIELGLHYENERIWLKLQFNGHFLRHYSRRSTSSCQRTFILSPQEPPLLSHSFYLLL